MELDILDRPERYAYYSETKPYLVSSLTARGEPVDSTTDNFLESVEKFWQNEGFQLAGQSVYDKVDKLPLFQRRALYNYYKTAKADAAKINGEEAAGTMNA